jgi:hypothetical protein
MPKFAEGTYNLIYGRLGDAANHEEGFEVSDAVLGQTVEDKDRGQFYTPAMVEFTARVVLDNSNENPNKKWHISSIRILQ